MTMNFKILWTLQNFLISLNSILNNSYNTWLTHFVHMSFYLPVAKLPQKQCYLNGQEIFISCTEVPCEWGEHLNGPSSFYLSFSLWSGGSHVWRELAQWGHSWAFLRSKDFFFFYTADLKWVRVWGVNVLWMNTAPGLRLEVTHKVHASRDLISHRQSRIDTPPRYMATQSRVHWRAQKNGADGAISVCCTRNW